MSTTDFNPCDSPLQGTESHGNALVRPRLWQPVLWQLVWREQRLLLLSLTVLLFVFGIIYVWLMSFIKLDGLSGFLSNFVGSFEKLSGVPFKDVATIEGRIALGFVDPVVLLTMTVWSVTRGSDFVSGELDRGTLELILAQPIRRMSFYLAKVTNTLLGIVCITLAFWSGISLGVQLVHPDEAISGWLFWPGVVNIAMLGVMISGVSTAMSSWDRFRWRTIGIMGGCYATWLLCKILFKMGGPSLKWIGWITPFRWFEPQLLVREVHDWQLQLTYDGVLLGIGGLGYCVAAVIFCRRDLPAPL